MRQDEKTNDCIVNVVYENSPDNFFKNPDNERLKAFLGKVL